MKDEEVLNKVEDIVNEFIVALYSETPMVEDAAVIALGRITATLILRGYNGRNSSSGILPEQAKD